MSMQRRSFLKLGVAGAATVGGASLLGALQANAAQVPAGRSAPTTPFGVGVRQYNWTRGSRKVTTFIYYPSTGKAGGDPVTNAPVAPGVFPICEFMHGFSSSPQKSMEIIGALAQAGFMVPAPYFANLTISDVYDGNQSRDISELITRTLALNTSNDPLAGHLDTTAGLGVSGHSMGGMTTHGLLTAWPDPRITAAIPMSCVDMGNPSSSVHAKVLFMHGDKDTTCAISSARQAYSELPAPKAFLTFKGGTHTSYWADPKTRNTFVDWMRWALYGDTAARDRLSGDASSSKTTWQFVPGPDPTTSPTTPPVTTAPATTPPATTPPATTPPATTPPATTPPATTSPTTTAPPTTPPPTTTSAPGGAVTATYRTTNTWPGGYQADVTVTAGSAPIHGWTVRWTLGNGQSVSQVWNGVLGTSGSTVTVGNATYNGSLAAHASATFGLLGTGSPMAPTLTVTAS